jgi:hypothetical protein
MSADHVLTRTVTLLLRSFAPTNTFLLARLTGRSEREVAPALAALERVGLATCEDSRWRLTSLGAAESRRSRAQSERSANITQYRAGRPTTTGKRR